MLPDLVNSIERHCSMTKQVEQGVTLDGKGEASGQQLDGSCVLSADGCRILMDKIFMLGEQLGDHSEEHHMLPGEAIWRALVHAEIPFTEDTHTTFIEDSRAAVKKRGLPPGSVT